MKLEEIKKQFDDEWVLIEVLRTDESYEILDGKVLFHHPNKRKVIEEMGKFCKGPKTTLAVEYTGEIPEDLVVMF